ncbi:nucleotide-binding universal stress UspA family protein [Pseudorhodoplanes sinuspersici]|uniref:Universal stress protein UspA n=2 Tax=Pseudorhodoplanes sinuspersici TaxID=1235591 RepID=A0A1W6ZZI0_9HYPH|nr:universal stress protein UspA [Pseudorhodoplanes sinuspersici]RKE69632.1 nucleotide-binding universal stress UspA family protein [Pseudorhodoplanes sinuspersici]
MKRILVATDFSTRSDRALRRSILLARQYSADVTIIHVIDDDQPSRLLKAEEREAAGLLDDLAVTVREIDRVRCETRLVLGEPFEEIAETADVVRADVIVMGPHRRQALRDVFIGTTIERTIRHSFQPVIMANAVPAGRYDRVLVATDLSACSATAITKARELGILDHAKIAVVHALDTPVQSMTFRSSIPKDRLKEYFAEEEKRAAAELTEFLTKVGLQPSRSIVQCIELSAPETIGDCIREHKADLVVIGTHGRTGAEKFFLGSVAEEILRRSEIDVFVVPASSTSARLSQPQ